MWTTTTSLMSHQRDAVAKLLPSRVGGLYMDMGTGKGLTLLELARIRQGKCDRLVWFCPVTSMENVRREILKHTDLTDQDIVVFGTRTRLKTLPLDRAIYVIGIESIQSSNRILSCANAVVTETSFVAVDESTYIKGPYSKRTQRITLMSEKAKYRVVMSGTPLTQGAVDLYAQMRFLSPKILGYNSFNSFAANHLEYRMRNYRNFRGELCQAKTNHIVRSHNVDVLAAKIAPYTYQVLAEECLDLPDRVYKSQFFSMTEAQRVLYDHTKSHYLEMAEDALDDTRSGYFAWQTWIFQLFTALQSVVCGFTDASDPKFVEHDRIHAMLSALAQVPDGERVVVWSKFLPATDQIISALEDHYGAGCCAEFTGRNPNTRDAQVDEWRAGKRRFLVSTQSAGGHAQTWTEAAYVLFYADTFKFSDREQAEKRTHRIGQSRKVRYVSLHCNESIDDRIAESLSRKGNYLHEFQQEMQDAKKIGLKQRLRKLVEAL